MTPRRPSPPRLDFGDRLVWHPPIPPAGPPCPACHRPMVATEHDFGARCGVRMVWWCDDHPHAFLGRV
jgi:hypothetical protein